MAHNHVELFAFQSCRSDPAAPLDQTDRAAAARLVRSCLAKPYKLHKGEPWPRDLPVKPRPHTVWYETASVPPPPAAVITAAAALASDLTPPERTSASSRTRTAQDLPEFQHWRHHGRSARSGPTRSRRDNHPGAEVSAPSATTAQPNQGLLRKRPPPAAVAGAWAPTSGSSALLPQGSAHDESIIGTRQTTTAVSSGGGSDRAPPGRQKKSVRLESPRTTAARTTAASATTLLPSSSRSPLRHGVTTRTGQPTTESAAVSRRDKIVPVPRRDVRPRPSSSDHDDGRAVRCSPAIATAAAKPSRGIGAIERCIPPPYAHRILDPLLNPVTDAYDLNPARQEPSAVLHSFVDPDYSRRRRQSSEEARGKVKPEMPLSSPLTIEFLTPGRRGAWLIPLSEGEGPIPPYTSPVTWPDKTLPASRDSSSAKTTTRKARSSTDGGEASAVPLEWTDARLVVLWIYLTGLHEGRGFGHIRAQAISGRGSSPGDLLKINCDAHLALAIRGLLNHLNVKSVAKRVGARGGGGGGGDNSARERLERLKREGACNDDNEKWLKGRALVWVDEQSRAILTA